MIREVVLDTETTGFNPSNGDRLVEIAALEVIDRKITGKSFHVYINPERDVPNDAFKIHGLSYEFLSQCILLLALRFSLHDHQCFAASLLNLARPK